jgi:hypothetical protein
MIITFLICIASNTLSLGADMLYVTNYGGVGDIGRVGKYTTDGMTINSSYITSLINYPTDVALDSSGNIYTAHHGTGVVIKTDPTGNNSVVFIDLNSSDREIAFDSQGNFYTNYYVWPSGATGPTGTINKYDSTGALLNAQLISVPNGYLGINNFSFDSQDTLYVNYSIPIGTTNKASIISKYDSNGNLLNGNYVTGLGPWAGEIVFDKQGNMLVVDWNVVNKYNPQGVGMGVFATNTGVDKGGIGMAIDSNDNIYLSNLYDRSISKFSSSGAIISQSFITGLNNPRGLAIQPASVPEPSTYALATIASVLMALSVRRRNRSKVCLIDL